MVTFPNMFIFKNCKALGNFLFLDKGDVKPFLLHTLTPSYQEPTLDWSLVHPSKHTHTHH